jgi:hypothetical protein
MLIAKQISPTQFQVGNYWELFPQSSFPTDGPNAAWYTENNCYKVNLFVPYDLELEEIRPVEPYLLDGWVYTSKAFTKEA